MLKLSLKTNINERFSKSISYLSFKHDSIVIPWIIKYSGLDINEEINYKPLQLVLKRLVASKVNLLCVEGHSYESRDYKNQDALTKDMHDYYRNNKYQSKM